MEQSDQAVKGFLAKCGEKWHLSKLKPPSPGVKRNSGRGFDDASRTSFNAYVVRYNESLL